MYLKKKLKVAIAFTTSLLILFSSIAPTFAGTQKSNKVGVGINNSYPTTVADSVYSKNSEEKSYLIGFKENVDRDKVLAKKSLDKKMPKKFNRSKSVAVKLNSSEVQDLKNDKDILYVEVDSIATIESTGPALKGHSSVKNMKEDTQTTPWGITTIGADLTLADNDEGKNISVAVLDTGIAKHPDLKVKRGISFVANTVNYSDDNGHGTHVAGTIASVDNRIGVVGVAPMTDLYAVKVLDQYGSGTYSQIIDGIEWAIDNKMDIINMSFGGTEDSQALHDAIKEANNHGIIIVAAAGNNGAGIETEVYPARYPEVISVGAVDQTFQRANYSSTGSEIDLVAPGSGILSTTSDGEYGVMSGTSMATPHVTGSAAVLWSKNRKWTNGRVKEKLYQTATPLGEQHDYGYGLVNVANALGLNGTSVTPPPTVPGDVYNPTGPDDLFYMVKIDVQLAEYKSKLRNLFEMANKNGDIQLAKKIEGKLNVLILDENKLRILPDSLRSVSKEKAMAEETKSQLNSYFALNADAFMELEYSYQRAIDEFTNIVSVTSFTYGGGEKFKSAMTISNKSEPEFKLDITPYPSVSIPKLIPGPRIPEKDKELEEKKSSAVQVMTAASAPTISMISATSTSVTLNAVFPISGAYGNAIIIQDYCATGMPETVLNNNWYATDGTYTITNLYPGAVYYIYMDWYTDSTHTWEWQYISLKAQTQYSTAETLTRTDGTYVFTSLENSDMAYAPGSYFSRWIGHLDSAYLLYSDLVGRVPYNSGKIEIKSTRNDFGAWAIAGNPIMLAQPFVRSQMSKLYSNDDWSFGILHELGHDFDSYAWNFSSEFFANFKMYYIVETLGATVNVGERYYIGGAQLADYYRIDSSYGSYNNTLANGTYHHDGLTYLFIKIRNTIGWQPFKDTFRYFNNLSSSQIPSTNIGKFNLFISMLSQYSNYDVRSIFTSTEINAIQNYFGGTIAQNYATQIVSENIPTQMVAGNSYTVSITVKNTGLNTWTESNSYRLGAIGDSDPFAYGRQTISNGSSVDNNQTCTFTFTMTAPSTLGTYTTDWQMVRDGYCWFGNTLVSKQVNVVAAPVQNIYLNSSIDVDLPVGLVGIYKFTPISTGTYDIITSPYAGAGASNDTYLELYTDAALTNRITYDDDSAGNLFSKISTSLISGTTYYIKLRPYNIISGAVHAKLTVNIGVPTPQTIGINTPVDVDLGAGLYRIYKFTPATSATYNIFTGPYGGTGSSNDTYIELYTDSGLTNKIKYDDDSAGNQFSKITTPLTGGITYYIKLRPYGTWIAVHARLTVTKVVPIQTLNLDVPIDTQVAEGEYNIFRFTPSTQGLYKFFTGPYAGTGSSSDTYLELYTDTNLTNMILDDDDSGGEFFSLIELQLQANITYYLKLRGYDYGSASARLTVQGADNLTWYKIGVGNKTVYIKEPEAGTSNIEARVCDNGSNTALVYSYVGGQWLSDNSYAYVPETGGGVTVASVQQSVYSATYGQANGVVGVSNFVNDIVKNVQEKADEIKGNLLNSLGFDEDSMTSEDWSMVGFGITTGIVDCTFPERNNWDLKTIVFNKDTVKALLFKIKGMNETDADNDYYYIKSKTNTEFAIMIAARTAEAVSNVAAVAALEQAGVSFTGGLAMFGASGGTLAPISIAIEVESATALIASGVCAIAGRAIGDVADSAESAFKGDAPKAATAEADKLFAELEANGIKFTREETQWICKTPSGEITWLETGSDSAGLQHIMLRHSTEFSSWGLSSQEAVSTFIESAVKNGTPNVIGAGDNIYNVVVNGVTKQMEVITGSNGFIVTAHPYTP